MAGVKISALPAVGSALTTDFFPVVQAGVTSRETVSQVQTLFGFSSGILSLSAGGTGAALTASTGSITYSGASALALSAVGSSGQLFQSAGTSAPSWTTSTYPSTNAVNTLLYASSANVMAALPTANNGVLVTSAGGVPSISSTLPSAVQSNITSLGTISSIGAPLGLAFGGTNKNMTASAGGIVWTDADSMEVIAGNANAGKMLRSGAAAAPTWSTATYPSLAGTSGNVLVSDGSNFTSSSTTSITALGAQAQALNMNSHLINNVTDPVSAQDAATRNYVNTNTLKSVGFRVITSTSTYTPTANAKYFLVQIVGGGGGAGAITGGTAGNAAMSGGGAGGGYTQKIYSAAEMGANAAVTIGLGGAGGTGAGAGSPGGTSTFDPGGTGGTLTAPGGNGGSGMTQGTGFQIATGGVTDVGSGGDFDVSGCDGMAAIAFAAGAGVFGGRGGASYLCTNSYVIGVTTGGGSGGTRAASFGQGATGRYSVGTGGSTGDGQAGNPGICLITEYISAS